MNGYSLVSYVIERSLSKSQQRLFGMVHAYQQGKLPGASTQVKRMAKTISYDDVKDFAEVSHTGLPERKKKKKNRKK